MNVYLIHATGTNRYKIGITTRTIESRMKELNSSQAAFPLTLITSIRSDDYKGIEKHLHDKYKSSRVYGEWFQFSQNQLIELQQYMLTFDTPLNQFKPILNQKSQTLPLQQKSSFQLPTRGIMQSWFVPVTLAIGLVYLCRNVEFFQPRNASIHTSTHTVLRRK